MLSKQQIKIIRGLQLKKNRMQSGLFICEGAKIVHELLHSSLKINKIYALKEWIIKNEGFLGDKNIVQEISSNELLQISELSTPNEVLSMVHIPEQKLQSTSKLGLALDSIRDPGNLGTIIRIADWYGLSQLICSEDCADAYNAKVVQASMGSLFRIQIHYLPLIPYLKNLKTPIYGAALNNSENLHTFKGKKSGTLIIGNESNGLSDEVLAACDVRLHIPRFGKAESLNAAIATGIFLDTMIKW